MTGRPPIDPEAAARRAGARHGEDLPQLLRFGRVEIRPPLGLMILALAIFAAGLAIGAAL